MRQGWNFFVYLSTSPKGLPKCPPFSANPPYSWLRCDCFNAQKCGCCNYHLHKQDSSFIDMLPLIRQELGSKTMAEATRGSPAPGTRYSPASSVNADDQQKRPVIHSTLAFLINFQSALLGVLVWWFDPQICASPQPWLSEGQQCRLPEQEPLFYTKLYISCVRECGCDRGQ